VPRTTLRNRYLGIPLRYDTKPNSRKLTNLEESVIVRYILDLDSRSFPPRIRCVKDIVNRILLERGKGRVKKN
jgi:hypothetical protein